MPFEGFLGDVRARPLGLRMLGYAASLAIHGPPLTVFAVAWLTRVLVLDHALDLPTPRAQLSYYQVPVQLMDGIPGDLMGDRGPSAVVVKAGPPGGRAGDAGAGRRRSRRPLTYAHSHKRVIGPVPLPTPVGIDEHGVPVGTGTGLSGVARGESGNGTAERGAHDGQGHAMGTGSGLSISGRGALARANQEPVSLEAKLASWIPPELHKRERALGKGGDDDEAEAAEGEDTGTDDVAVVGPPLPGKPQRISMNFAAYLRTYEPFPSLPESCWPPGRLTNSVLLEICVSERGSVEDVMVRQSAGDEVDEYLTTAVRTWRYRPRMVQGIARPFCHPIRVIYTRAQRFDRW